MEDTENFAMKIPEKSPRLDALLARFSGGDSRSFAEFLAAPYSDDRYFSYEDLKRRPLPPFARDADEWWLKIQIARQGKFRELPLRDTVGAPFRYFVDDADSAVLHELDFRGGGIIECAETLPNSRESARYLVSSLMEESIASSLLEGAPTTREKAKEMLRRNRAPRDEGERMVLNNYNTMLKLKTWKDEPLTPELICRIHAEISAGTMKPDAEGRFRTADEKISVGDDFGNEFYVPPAAELLPERIAALCAFAGDEGEGRFLHPVVKAIVLHFWLAYEHPFCDGNGRTARALFYWFLMKKGYWVCEYISISTAIRKAGLRYYRAFLDVENNGNDLNYFIKFHLEILRRAVAEFLDYVEKRRRERTTLSEEFRRLDALNSRQKTLLESWLRHPHRNRETDARAYQTEHGVSRESARQDLGDLVKRGLAVRRRDGRAFVFVPAPDFEARLGS